MSTGYIPKIDTARAAAAAAKWERASAIVWRNDLKIIDGDIVELGVVVVVSLAAAPPRGKEVAAVMVLRWSELRFSGWKG